MGKRKRLSCVIIALVLAVSDVYKRQGDKDALQLATDITKVIFTKRGISEFEVYDREAMLQRYGLTPEQFIDLKGLMGDASDNIPGIPCLLYTSGGGKGCRYQRALYCQPRQPQDKTETGR